jgi:hypothetical protein
MIEGWIGKTEGKNIYAVSREKYWSLSKNGSLEKFAIYWFNDIGTLICNGMVIGRMQWLGDDVEPPRKLWKIEYVKK